jgi:pimeloyl-ACP methyl ester carboxylesterase
VKAPAATKVDVNGVQVVLRRTGKGPPVIFFHGADGYTQWLPFFDALAEQHEILVPEHPGFGASDDPPLIRSVSDMAMFYLDFLETLDLKDVHFVGHSLGGWIAAEILIRDRARAKSLTVMSSAGLRVEGVTSGDIFIWNREELLRNMFHDQAYAEIILALNLTDEQIDVSLKNRFTATKLGWQPRWYNPDLEKWLHRIKLPSLVLWGDDDKVMPPAYAKLWLAALPKARLAMIKDCGHIPQVEKQAEAIAVVRDFLKEVTQ